MAKVCLDLYKLLLSEKSYKKIMIMKKKKIVASNFLEVRLAEKGKKGRLRVLRLTINYDAYW